MNHKIAYMLGCLNKKTSHERIIGMIRRYLKVILQRKFINIYSMLLFLDIFILFVLTCEAIRKEKHVHDFIVETERKKYIIEVESGNSRIMSDWEFTQLQNNRNINSIWICWLCVSFSRSLRHEQKERKNAAVKWKFVIYFLCAHTRGKWRRNEHNFRFYVWGF